MATYRNIGGEHITADGKTIKNGGTFVSNDPTLLKRFSTKFTKVDAGDVPTEQAKPSAPVAAVKPADAPKAPVAAVKPTAGDVALDEDVTSEFPTAADAGLVIKKDKRGWWVFDEADDNPANEKPLLKKEVEDFIDEYIG